MSQSRSWWCCPSHSCSHHSLRGALPDLLPAHPADGPLSLQLVCVGCGFAGMHVRDAQSLSCDSNVCPTRSSKSFHIPRKGANRVDGNEVRLWGVRVGATAIACHLDDDLIENRANKMMPDLVSDFCHYINEAKADERVDLNCGMRSPGTLRPLACHTSTVALQGCIARITFLRKGWGWQGRNAWGWRLGSGSHWGPAVVVPGVSPQVGPCPVVPWARSPGVSSWHVTAAGRIVGLHLCHCVTAMQTARGLAASRLRLPPSAAISLPPWLCQVSTDKHRRGRTLLVSPPPVGDLLDCVGAAHAVGRGGCLILGDSALKRQGPGSARAARMAGWSGAGFADGAAEISSRGPRQEYVASTASASGGRCTYVLTVYVDMKSLCFKGSMSPAPVVTGCSPGSSYDTSWNNLGHGRTSTRASSFF